MNAAAEHRPDGQWAFVRFVARCLWLALGLWLLIWLVLKNFPLSGRLSASVRTAEPSGFIQGFSPFDRAAPVRETGSWYSDLVGDPVYFHVAAPKLYDRVRVRLRYKDDGQPYVALGMRPDPAAWAFDLKPIDLPILDGSGWAARQDGDFRIYERRSTRRSAVDLLNGSSEKVGVLGVDPVRWGMKLPALANEHPVEAVTSYAGARTIYIYVQKNTFAMTLGIQGPDEASVRASLVHQGRTLLSRERKGAGTIELQLTGAEPGLYRIDLSAPASVTLTGLQTPHQRLVLRDTDGEHLHAPVGASAFMPEFPVVTWETDLARAPFDAVVARYRPPAVDGDGWRTAEAEFDLRAVSAPDGQAQMAVSLPAIGRVGGKLRVDRVDVEYIRPPFRLDALRKLFTRIRSRL